MSKIKSPKVSILLPVYNGEKYLRETIDSVLAQDFTDYEFLIINDGSKDGSQKIIDEYAKKNSKIIPIKQENQGLVKTLNKGIKQAKGKYIARIDADDVWFYGKLKKQVKELDKDDELVLIGGSFEVVNEDGSFIRTFYAPTEDSHIKEALLLYNPFGHAGVVYRKDAAEKAGMYSDKVGPTEDYDLWIKLSKLGKLKNLSSPVFRYRDNEEGISNTNRERQIVETRKNADSLWQDTEVSPKSTKEINKQCEYYLRTEGPSSRGEALKTQYLYDCVTIGFKMIRYGRKRDGTVHLISIMFTGRSGVKAIKTKLKYLDIGSLRLMTKVNAKRLK